MKQDNSIGRKLRQQELQALFAGVPIKKSFGMELSFREDGSAVFDMPHNPSLDSPVGIHGGIIATLLDNAGWFAAAPNYDTWITTTDLNIKYLNHAENVHMRATGRTLLAGKRIAMSEMEILSEDGKVIAVGTGTFAVTSVKVGA